jgi:hypothetical protein
MEKFPLKIKLLREEIVLLFKLFIGIRHTTVGALTLAQVSFESNKSSVHSN